MNGDCRNQKAQARSRILIVDDEAEILVALCDLLEDDFDILSTTSPHKGLELLKAHPDIAVIISDQRMPGMSGDLFLTKAGKITDAKSILLTGFADLSAVISAINQGHIQFYIHKPWDSGALKAMVRESATRHRLDRALQQERVLLQSTMRAATFDIVFSDAEGVVIRHNRDRSDQTGSGHASTDILQLREVELYPPEEHGAISVMRQQVVRDGLAEERVAVERGGAQRWIEKTRILLPWPRHPDGALFPAARRWQASFERDVTDRLAMERQMHQDDKLRALGTLSGGIAHDFNNLLTAILGSLDLVKSTSFSSPADTSDVSLRLLDNAVESAQRGATLTRGLLEFARPKTFESRPVDVISLVLNMRELLAQSLNRASDAGGATGKCTLDLKQVEMLTNPLYVSSELEQLEMALLNLCINARDAMPLGGVVAISVGETVSGDGVSRVIISVTDNGQGMEPDVAARIFDPFFTTKEVGHGTGLGLSTIYSFLKRSNGDIAVESSPGKGSQISLVLPKADIAEYAELAELPEKQRLNDQLRILLVDDDASVRLVTMQYLANVGHIVSDVSDGEAAVKSVAAGHIYDLAIIDLTMPGMGGRACGAALRSISQELRILYISGFADDAHFPPGVDVLAKPFTPQVLETAIAKQFC